MKDLMIDIETLDTANTAMIASIACVEFDLVAGETGFKFYEIINLKSYDKLLNNPFTHSLNTLLWWLNQSKESQSIFDFNAKKTEDIIECLRNFTGNFDFKDKRIWTKGNFDIPILEYALRACGQSVPWKYWQIMDMRTILKLSELKFENKNTHNALDDCYNQINQLTQSLKSLKIKL